MNFSKNYKFIYFAVAVCLIIPIVIVSFNHISKESRRRWLKQCVNVQGDISGAEIAERCYKRAEEIGGTGIFGGWSCTEWLLAAIEFQPENSKYWDALVCAYEEWWNWEKCDITDINPYGELEQLEVDYEVERFLTQRKIKRMIKNYKNN
jgi:hypothetical protein